ncbi:SDR family oxidoreductase [Pseudomaricurvus alkylphenolicus]|nr:SDR family oxidoreductase [Pseudomaricurvus alkylphenolicus]
MNTEMFSLKGRVALITGASSGIGYTLAKGFSAAGATVVIAARRIERLQALEEDIQSKGGKVVSVNMDVVDRDSVNAGFSVAQDQVGVIDVIVNNAGVADPKNFMSIDEDCRDYVMNTNFNGVWNVAQEGARRMIESDKPGSIVNIASILALGVQKGQSVYCASKAAVAQLTKSLALDLAKQDIRVNALAPGWFKTEMNQDYFDSKPGLDYIGRMPARRLGNLEELVGPALLLASAAGAFVNGAVLPVDGAIDVVKI